ncbi:magnesium transporter [Flammeovirgaceae bacterium SG7u.111]|nr:magnesium transporter [Flammeovirgaceae bacterium SG7u.132]WPO36140.1 magnesium transporter [Flammeovirgaceae bacterium SG7u.111]
MSLEPTKEFLEEIKRALADKDDEFIIQNLSPMHEADISVLLDQLDSEESKHILELLDKEVGADIISNLEEDTREEFLKIFTPKELASYIEHTDSDDAADILNEQPAKVKEEVLAQMINQEKVAHVLELLKYDEDCAGGLMAKELIKANINWTIKQCIEEIRRQTQQVEKILTVYVVDNEGRLLGRVSLKKIILSNDDTKVKDIFVSDLHSVQTFQSAEEVADIMQKYDLEAVPVVSLQGKLVGRITIDDIVDVITEQAEINQQIMSGLSEDVEEDDNIWMLSRARLPWLLIGMMGGLLAAQIMGFFEGDLANIPAMALFVPLITATGGNVGIQSSTIIVQTLANSSAMLNSSMSQRLFKVFLVAIINGLVIAAVVFCFNLFFSELSLAIVVSIALFSVVLLASFMGTITPLVLSRFGVNPAVASGPFITTANDLLGLAVYFMVARSILG